MEVEQTIMQFIGEWTGVHTWVVQVFVVVLVTITLDFFSYTFTHTTNWLKFHAIKQDMLLRIAAIIGAHGAEIAFPTSTVQLPGGVRVLPAAGGSL